MGRVAFLSDRSPSEALPSLHSVGLDVKVEPLSAAAVASLSTLAADAVLVDAAPDPALAFRLLSELPGERLSPVVVLLEPSELERFPWADVADDFVLPETSPEELRLRLAMLARRSGNAGEPTLRLGPLSMNPESYQAFVAGRRLDLTYREFELLRFLVQHPGRVFTRGQLLQQVWGYNFYGGARTVDVHVRRLRAKLGGEHEHVIHTVRGVGYSAAAPT